MSDVFDPMHGATARTSSGGYGQIQTSQRYPAPKRPDLEDDDDDRTVIASGPAGASRIGGSGAVGRGGGGAQPTPRSADPPSTEAAHATFARHMYGTSAAPPPPPAGKVMGASGHIPQAPDIEIEMVLLMADGAKYKQPIVPLVQFGSAAAVCDMALEAWTAAAEHAPRGSLRIEALRYNGDRLLLSRSSPPSALKSIAELRVSAGGGGGAPDTAAASTAGLGVASTHLPPPHSANDGASIKSMPAVGEDRWVKEASMAASAAIERTAIEATATTNVLHELMTALGTTGVAAADGAGGGSTPQVSQAAAMAAALTSDEAAAAASAMAMPTTDTSAIGTSDVLPPALLEQMRPKLAAALQQAAALAVQTTEQRAEVWSRVGCVPAHAHTCTCTCAR